MNNLSPIIPSLDTMLAECTRLMALVVKPISLCETLGLITMEEKITRQLMAEYPTLTPMKTLYMAASGKTNFTGNVPDVQFSRLFKKLNAAGIEVKRVRSVGVVLTPAAYEMLMRMAGALI